MHAGRAALLRGTPRGHRQELLPGQLPAPPQLSSPGFTTHRRWPGPGQGSAQPGARQRREHIQNPFPKEAGSSPAIPGPCEGCRHFANLCTHGPVGTSTYTYLTTKVELLQVKGWQGDTYGNAWPFRALGSTQASCLLQRDCSMDL